MQGLFEIIGESPRQISHDLTMELFDNKKVE